MEGLNLDFPQKILFLPENFSCLLIQCFRNYESFPRKDLVSLTKFTVFTSKVIENI